MIHSWGDHIGKRTAWSFIYFLIYAYLNILAQSQILVISLYLGDSRAKPEIYCYDRVD